MHQEQQLEIQNEANMKTSENTLKHQVDLLTTELVHNEETVSELRMKLKHLRQSNVKQSNVKQSNAKSTHDELPLPPPPPPLQPKKEQLNTIPPEETTVPESHQTLNNIWEHLLTNDPATTKIIQSIQHGNYHRSKLHFQTAINTVASKYANYLTIDKLLGIILIVEAHATNPGHTQVLPCLTSGEIGGLFIARSNQENNRTYVQQQLLKFSKASNVVYGDMVPLLLSSDDEGGRRNNYPNIYEKWSTLMSVGATNDPSRGYHYGKGYGADLKSIGMNIVFSPDSDVNTEPSNPVIGPRSFGSSPTLVSNMVNRTIRGFLDSGIMPTLKHWPGHGSTTTDSHVVLPVVVGALNGGRLSRVELLPFNQNMLTAQNLNGAPILMSAHVLAKGIDPKFPISISKIALIDTLRKKLGYEGVIVSDALNMHGLTSFLKIDGTGRVREKTATYLAALESGNDLLLDSSSSALCGNELTTVRNNVLAKIQSNDVLTTRLIDAGTRVIALKLKIWAKNQAMKQKSIPFIKPLKLKPLPSPLHMWQRDDRPFPLISSSPNQRILFIVPHTLSSTISNATYPLLQLNQDVRVIEYHQQPSCTDEKKLIEAMAWSGVTIFLLHNFNTNPNVLIHHVWMEQMNLVTVLRDHFARKITNSQLRMIVISNENPYDLRYLSSSNRKDNTNIKMRGSNSNNKGGTAKIPKITLMSFYDTNRISMNYLGHSLIETTTYPVMKEKNNFIDIGFWSPLEIPKIPNRPCPKFASDSIGNDPANHKTRWNKETRLEKNKERLKKKEENEKQLRRDARI